MNDFAIYIENLSKRYRIGKAPERSSGSKQALKWLAAPFRYLASTLQEASPDEIIWAVKDINFEVKPGEVVGIIGRNGAGKSTLLKILSRITEPTSGRALINGRVGSLLEVGTGFHPELTGRENIYMNGAVLGMRRGEIDRKFDEIVAFAETEKFLDTPVKRYSSGMYVRLAFAVAAHLEPEILLVDEVLAVGDSSFQKKCLGKMGDVATQGRTVLFVSHNMVAIQNLCSRVIWLNGGKVMEAGQTDQVVSKYLSTSFSPKTEQVWNDLETAPGNDKVRLHRVCVRPEGGQPPNPINMETPIEIEIEYWNLVPNAQLHVCFHLYTEHQIVAFSSASNEMASSINDTPLSIGLYKYACHVPASLLNSGVHRLLLLILRNTSKILFKYEDALIFEVLDVGVRPGTWYGKEPGAVRPRLDWTMKKLQALSEGSIAENE